MIDRPGTSPVLRTREVDRDSRLVLDMIAAAGRPPVERAGVAAAREGMRASRLIFGATVPETIIRDLYVPGPGGDIPVRLYRPMGLSPETPLPLLVFFHGGGWVLGDIETGDAFCASLVRGLRIAVAAVDYRLAPEHPFPAAVEDGFCVLDWLMANFGALGICAERVAVGGDSAGGNLAAVCALHARGRAFPPLRSQILLYPVTDLRMTSQSYRRNATGYLLTVDTMRWFRDRYLAGADPDDWRASPLRAENVENVAPALIATCGFDPLHDEGEAYAERLRGAGVPTCHLSYPSQVHGFAMWGKLVSDATKVLGQVIDELNRRLF